jgi:branched-subunit amino acid ABC-type transport system permease component
VSNYLPFIVIGVSAGSLYGLAGMGLVLAYKTSGIFNFGHGAIAAAGAFAFYELHVTLGWPWPIALLVALVAGSLVFGVGMERVARSVSGVSASTTIVATVGILLLLQGGLTLLFGSQTRDFPQFLPTETFKLASVHVQYAQLIVAVTGLVLAVALYAFFRYSRLGSSMRAVVDSPSLVSLTGTSPVQVRLVAWIVGCGLALLSGILIAPTLGLDASLLTLLIVQAFGAVAIGRFSSLPMTYAGGVIVGVLAALATKVVASTPSLNGLPASVPFLVLFAVLLIRPPLARLRLGTSEAVARRRAAVRRVLPARVAVPAMGAGLIVLCLVPAVVGSRLPVYTNFLTFALIFLSLGLLVSMSGQISLCHAAFAALGATTFSHLTHGAGLPWVVALLLAGLATVPLGAIVAIPAIRLSGIYLALATFGFGILLERVVYPTALMFGGRGFRLAPRPGFAHTDNDFYFVVLAVVVVACVAVVAIVRGRLGRMLRALGDSPTALVTHGLSVNVTRVLVFCLSAMLAGVAGALFISFPGQASGVGFDFFQSLVWVAVIAIAGRRVLPAAFAAAALLVVVPAYIPDSLVKYQTFAFGVLAVVVAIAGQADWRALVRGRSERSPVRERTVTRRLEATAA